jgi:carbon monoxide dehydrogenase subunit G
MEIKESFRVNCSIQEVWEFIIDPHKIGSCLPSVQSIEVLDETHYKAVVKQKVGFITATFQINTEVLEKEAPNRLVLANQGKTILGAQGSMRSQDSIILTAVSEQETEISVQSELKMGGQLAILGAKLIESKSKEIFAEATANMRNKLEKGSN